MSALICLIFFASGASALVFETLWFHQAGLVLGNSVWASSLVLSGFMGGLALGNALASRYGDAVARPLRLYAVAETCVAAGGVALVWILPSLGSVLAPLLAPLSDHGWALNLVRLVLAFGLLLVPSTAMGLTLPLLTRTLTGRDPNFGRVLGRLYAWNTLGAVVGVIATEAWLVAALGIRGTALLAGTLTTFAAAAAGVLSLGSRWASAPRGTLKMEWPSAVRRWLVAAFLAGFALLALEVIWFRFLALFIESRSFAFALILATVLAGIALGGMVASRVLGVAPGAHRYASLVAFAAGTLCVVCYAAFPLVSDAMRGSDVPMTLRIAVLGVPLVLPVALASGALFTLLGAALHDEVRAEAGAAGALTFSNTVGATLGSLVAGFVLLPGLGMENSLFVLAALYGGIGALLLAREGPSPSVAYVGVAVFAFSAVIFPFGAMETRHLQVPVSTMTRPGDRLVAVREGLTETILYVEHRELGQPASYRMITNAYSMSATMWFARRYMDLYVVWPVAVHPKLERALLISYGVGTTAKALTDTAELRSIDVVDISRDVLEMNAVVYSEAEHPLNDPRVRVHVEDGRQFLQTTDRKFDLITSEPPPPQMAGVVNLYTREYFELLRERLAEGGIVTYWLPTHSLSERSSRSIVRAFCDAFEDCSLWNAAGANLMMVGTRDARGPVSPEAFARQWRQPELMRELRAIGLERPEQLGALFIGGADYLRELTAGVPPLVDDRPKRIVAEADSRQSDAEFFRSWSDVAAARERFRSSPLVAHLWPEEIRRETLPYFDHQRVVESFLRKTPPIHGATFGDVHYVLTESPLSTPVLWLLGSDGDKQRIVDEADAAARAHPQYQLHRGIGLVAERRFREALAPLRNAERIPQLHSRAIPLRIYALCMLGELEQAWELAREHRISLGEIGALAEYWPWLRAQFGIEA